MSANVMRYLSFFICVTGIFVTSVAGAAQPEPWQIWHQEPAGSIAEKALNLHNLLLIIITMISVFVLGLLGYTSWRFRRKANPTPSKTTHNTVIEILWTVIPVLILVVIAVPSFQLLYYMDETKNADMVIKVTGNQWHWNYEYIDEQIGFDSYMLSDEELKPGQPRLLSVDNPLIVPEGTKIKFLVTANDVMHSFFVPSLAVQTYAIIGRVDEVWIDVPKGEKTYYGQCNQICGVNHSFMPIVVKALVEDEYRAWLEDAKQEFAILETPELIQLAAVK